MEEINDIQVQVDILKCIYSELTKLYNLFFGRKAAPVEITIDTSDNSNLLYPITYRSTKKIILWCPNLYLYQFYYQLSHELCHWMIPRDVPNKLRWLEEVIAVMAPPFFASKVTLMDHAVLYKYISDSFQNAVPVDFPSLFVPGSETISVLENNEHNFTDYARYETIALKLLPAVEQYPAFWKAVPLLCDVDPAPDLKTSIDRWLALVEDSDVHSALSNVIGSLL